LPSEAGASTAVSGSPRVLGATALRRSLGALFGVAVGVGSMIGVGILRTPGIIVGHVGTPAWALAAWLTGAVYVLLCVNYMAELAGMVPRSGGAYVFAERSLGRFGGTVVGWSDFLNSVFAIALLAVALAEYIDQLFPALRVPPALLAGVEIGILTAVNLRSVRISSGAQQLTSALKLTLLWLIALACLVLGPAAENHPFLAAPSVEPVTATGAIAAFQLVLGALNGWAAPAYFGAETKDAARGAARSLLYGALVVSATYVLINVAILYVVPVATLVNSKLPAADAIERVASAHGLGWGLGGKILVAVAVLSLPSTLQAVMMQTSRTLHAMSVDGLFWRWGARVGERGAPFNATWVCGAAALFLAASSTFETLFLTFTVFAVLNNLILLCGVVRLRRREPDLPRSHRVIGYPWTLAPIVVVDLAVFTGFASTNLRQCLVSAALVAALFVAYRLHRRSEVHA